MQVNFSMGRKLFGLLVLVLNFGLNSVLYAVEPGDLYVFNKSKIHIEGVLSPFEATIDIQEQGLQK